MRNHRSGRLRISVLEDQAFAGQAVETGSNSTLGAQKAHAIGASGIERDQDKVGLDGGGREGARENKAQSEQDFSNHDSSNHGLSVIRVLRGAKSERVLAAAGLTSSGVRATIW